MKTWIKKQVKNLLLGKFIKNSLELQKTVYENCIVSLSEDSVWIYTLMKSGTTYSLLFLANYLNYLNGGRTRVSYDEMQLKFILHSMDVKIRNEKIEPFLKEHKKLTDETQFPRIIHTHSFIPSNLWSKNICLYRNPLDFIISGYYYFYINRGINISHPLKIYKELLDHFLTTYKQQVILKERYPDKVLLISYEKLMASPKEVFQKMIEFIGLPCDETGVLQAMEFSSKKQVKEMEKERGEAIVKKDGIKFSGSFVRSGKIGEWKEYFNENDLTEIKNYLSQFEVELDDFTIE